MNFVYSFFQFLNIKYVNLTSVEKMWFFSVSYCALIRGPFQQWHFYSIRHFFYSFYFDAYGWDVSFLAFINMQMTFSCPFFFCISIYNANFSQFAFALRLLCVSFYLYFSLSWASRIFAAAAAANANAADDDDDAEAVGSSQFACCCCWLCCCNSYCYCNCYCYYLCTPSRS